MNILSIDCGGSGLRKAVISGKKIFNIKESKKNKSFSEIIEFVKEDLSSIDGISYAVAGTVKDYKKIIRSPNLPFLNGVDLAKKTEIATKKKTFVFNDMEAASIGMSKFFPFLDYFLAITWSSGIGVRVVKNGKIISDCEAGHIKMDLSPSALKCGCGLKGCAESILGGIAIERRIKKEIKKRKIIIPKEFTNLNGYFHYSFDKKEKWAVDIYKDIVFKMALFLSNLQNTLFVLAIVWKGTLGKYVLQRKEKEIKKEMEKLITMNPEYAKSLKFYYSWDIEKEKNLCKDADALIGAAEIFKSKN